MSKKRDWLIELDSVVGDGDLGLTMSDGFIAAYQAVADSSEIDIGRTLYIAGKAMSIAVPSTMGTLMASGLMQAGKVLKGKTKLEISDVVALFQGYYDGVVHLGKANIGDKTFLDGFYPGLITLQKAVEKGDTFSSAAQKASKAAHEGYLATVGMLAIHGRAATRGEASRKLLDPGAAVADLIFQAFAKIV
ncbi:MAG: dihydroxyacetone kinase subunit L [Sphaerochaetaceae bacterium]